MSLPGSKGNFNKCPDSNQLNLQVQEILRRINDAGLRITALELSELTELYVTTAISAAVAVASAAAVASDATLSAAIASNAKALEELNGIVALLCKRVRFLETLLDVNANDIDYEEF